MHTDYPNWCLPLVSEEKKKKIKIYAEWLSSEGIKKGLISNKSDSYIWEEFIIHSLGFSRIITKQKQNKSICDLGTGAGIPGVPIAITNPEKEVFLVDRSKKRIHELERLKSILKIENFVPTLSSAEDFVSENVKKIDIFVSRCFMPAEKIKKQIFIDKERRKRKILLVSSNKEEKGNTFHVKQEKILLNNGETRNIDVLTLN